MQESDTKWDIGRGHFMQIPYWGEHIFQLSEESVFEISRIFQEEQRIISECYLFDSLNSLSVYLYDF